MTTLKPTLRFSEFVEDWEIKTLGELLEFKNGINAAKEQYGSGAKFINVLDILNNNFITHDKIVGSVNVDVQTLEKYSVSYGDILFQRSSETREEVGSANVYLDENQKATFGGFVIRGKKIGNYNPIFLNKLLKTDKARDSITSKSGGSTRYNVGQETLSSVSLLFPTIPEQTKIANFLTATDQKIEILKEKKSLIQQYKKGIMQQLFSQELRFKNNNGEDFPDWEYKSLEEILDYEQPIRYLVTSTEYNDSYKTPVLTAGKTFILGYTNESEGIFNEGLPVIIFDDFTTATKFVNFPFKAKSSAMKILIPKEKVNLNFVYEAMQQIEFIRGGHERHWISKYSFIEIPYPSLPEQLKIANFLTAIDEKIKKVNQQITNTQTFKKGLLQQMFV